MIKNPWFTLVIGLMVGLTLGYVLAERQPIPPGKALRMGLAPEATGAGALPSGHPPLNGAEPDPRIVGLQQQIAETQDLLQRNPDDAGLMVSLGDQYFELARATKDPSHWTRAGDWYQQALANGRAGDANVLTDLGVVSRNLGDFDRALGFLDRAIENEPGHWQAWYNKVIVLNFDLHDHDEARRALESLEAIAADNEEVPDLTSIRAEVMKE